MNLSEFLKKKLIQTIIRDAEKSDEFSAVLAMLSRDARPTAKEKGAVKKIIHDEARRYSLGKGSVEEL
mgnify:CR=1 FL=1